MTNSYRSPIRQALDPEGGLPDLSVTTNGNFGLDLPVTTYTLHLQAERVGTMTIRTYDHGAEALSDLWVNPKARGQRLGTAAHILAIEHAHQRAHVFETNPNGTTSPAVMHIWNRLAEQGLAEVVAPFEPTGEMTSDGPVFLGQYVVPILGPEL